MFAEGFSEWYGQCHDPEAEEGAAAADCGVERQGQRAQQHGCFPPEAASGLGTGSPEGAHPGAEVCPFGW